MARPHRNHHYDAPPLYQSQQLLPPLLRVQSSRPSDGGRSSPSGSCAAPPLARSERSLQDIGPRSPSIGQAPSPLLLSHQWQQQQLPRTPYLRSACGAPRPSQPPPQPQPPPPTPPRQTQQLQRRHHIATGRTRASLPEVHVESSTSGFNASAPHHIPPSDTDFGGFKPGQIVPRRVSAGAHPVSLPSHIPTARVMRAGPDSSAGGVAIFGPPPSAFLHTRLPRGYPEARPAIQNLADVMSKPPLAGTSRPSRVQLAGNASSRDRRRSTDIAASSSSSSTSSSSKTTICAQGRSTQPSDLRDSVHEYEHRSEWSGAASYMMAASGDDFGGGSGFLGQPNSDSGSGSRAPFGFSGSSFTNSNTSTGGGDAAGNAGEDDGNGGSDRAGDDKGKDKAKKANPLVDLIETEAAYVNELGKIIKKVAGAWSRSNFPPAELDTMFRNVESIYRINRAFLKSLKEIGPNPSSPRALGDLLMRWIDDLEAPYLRYCDNYFTDFDSWPTVQSNKKLLPLLEAVSETAQPDGSPVIYSDKKRQQGQLWTLDQLFALPQTRLRYYKKLYSRLLKSTQEGRSDHRLLVGANEKLDELLQHAKNRIAMSVLDEGPMQNEKRQSHESSGGDTTANTVDSEAQQRASSSTSMSASEQVRNMSSSREESKSSFSSTVLPRQDTPPQSSSVQSPIDALSRSSSTLRAAGDEFSVESLESRLDTSRTLDIFSMKPKKCSLRINPPGIPFTRALRKSADVVIHFTPSSTGQDLVIRRAHLFLLTDLFLICERMTPSEREQQSASGNSADMWLLYPPLAGKHLRVQEESRQDNTFTIIILKKEKLLVHTESREAKQQWIRQISECQQFGGAPALKVVTETDKSLGGASSALPTPAPSPSISVTPSENNGLNNIKEGDMIHDLTKMLDGSHPFSPPSPSPSRTPSLGRDNSFRSFAGQAVQPAQSPPPPDRSGAGVSSPALAATFGRPPEQRQGSLPPLSFSPSRVMSPPITSPSAPPLSMPPPHGGAMGSIRPPGNFGPAGAFGPNGSIRPPTLQNQLNGPPSHRDSPPMLPTSRPPPHLLGQRPPQQQQQQQPSFGWPPPAMNGFGAPPPGTLHNRPPNGFGSNGFGPPRPPPRPAMSLGPAPPNKSQQDWEPPRRPSEPNLRNEYNGIGRDIPPRSNDGHGGPPRTRSASSSGPPKLPSDFLRDPGARPQEEYSPPSSPTLPVHRGARSSTVAAQMRCRLYLKQGHQQWKALGNARLKLYHLLPEDFKQLVVENDKKPAPLISSIILADGVERVGKVGVAVELSDSGARTGIVYMLHLRSEESAVALFEQLLEGSDRTVIAADQGMLGV